MARNYSVAEVFKIVSEGKDLDAIADIGRRYPILITKIAAIVAKAGDTAVDFMQYMPEYVSANRVNKEIRNTISYDVTDANEVEEDEEAVEEKPAKGKPVKEEKVAEKPARGKKKPEPVEEEDDELEEEAGPDYKSMNAMELFKECKKLGIKAEPKKPAKYYLSLIEKATAHAEEEDWEEEEEEEKPAKPAKKEKPAAKPAKKQAEDEDEDWDI